MNATSKLVLAALAAAGLSAAASGGTQSTVSVDFTRPVGMIVDHGDELPADRGLEGVDLAVDVVARMADWQAAGPVERIRLAAAEQVAVTNRAGLRTSGWYARRAFEMFRKGITRVDAAPAATNGWRILASDDGQAVGTGKVLAFGRDLDAGELRIRTKGAEIPTKVLVIDAQDRLADTADWTWDRGGKTLVVKKPAKGGAVYLAEFRLPNRNRSVTPQPQQCKPGHWWTKRLVQKGEELKAVQGRELDVVFVGDSITHRWDRDGEGGLAVWNEMQASRNRTFLNLGYGSDRTDHVLWRFAAHGELDGYKARVFSVMIGTNNYYDRMEDVVDGIGAIIAEIRRRHPESKILLMGILPHAFPNRPKNDRTNAAVRAKYVDGKTVFWCDFGERLLQPDGKIDMRLFVSDRVHPNTEGYRLWRAAVEPILDKLLEGRK